MEIPPEYQISIRIDCFCCVNDGSRTCAGCDATGEQRHAARCAKRCNVARTERDATNFVRSERQADEAYSRHRAELPLCFRRRKTAAADSEREVQPRCTRRARGNQWYFGMKVHIAVDSKEGIVHSVCSRAASVADKHMLSNLLQGDEGKIWRFRRRHSIFLGK